MRTVDRLESLELRTHFAAGDLDLFFGVGGKAITSPDPLSFPSAVVIQPDGRQVVASTPAALDGAPGDIVLSRRELSGEQIAPGGVAASTTIAFLPDGRNAVSDLLITPASGLVLAGLNVANGRDQSAHIALLDSGFRPITSFGGDGIVNIPQPTGELKLLLQGDGKIVATDGRTIFRYTLSGNLDTSFGGDGITTLIDDGRSVSEPSVFLGTDAKIYVVSELTGFRNELLIARINPSTGALDTSFSGDGRAFVTGSAPLAAPLAGAKMMLVTRAGLGDAIQIRRINSDGSVDSTFATSGSARQPIPGMPLVPGTLLPSPDGKAFTVVGETMRSATLRDVFVARFNATTGAADESFGPGGVRVIDLFNNDLPLDAAVAPDGKIVFVGYGFSDDGNENFEYRAFSGRLIGTAFAPGARITSNGTLLVEGSELSEEINLFGGSGDRVITQINGVTQSFRASKIKRIIVTAGDGNDVINLTTTAGRSQLVSGGFGNDSITGNGRGNYFDAVTGNDTLIGLGGDDTLLGGDEDDRIVGGSGNDSVLPGFGADQVFGESGDDTIFGGDGKDLLNGGSGFDTATYRAGDTLASIDDADLLDP